MANRIKTIIWIIGAYITIVGVVTFSQFIHEEAIQTAIWGTWPAQDAKNWPLVKKGVILIKAINYDLKVITYLFGWVQPLAMIGYINYAKSTDYYIEGLEAKVFAFAPELYIGEEVEFQFYPAEIRNNEIAVNGKIGVYIKDHTEAFKNKLFGTVAIKGIVHHENNMLIIR